MNRVKVLVSMLHFGSFMILMAAITETIRRTVSWLRGLGKSKLVAA